ncbi:MAG TPA: preprotein translocase subunit SecE [Blastocatellia bacterium]|jgi:preprotein translocase subunit SecE|nr:preprotein translocase subunit SecE [Blastocatellia bacterium]
MATSSTREGTAAMAEDQNRQTLVSKPLSWVATVRQFWRDVALEMKKVSWPTRTEVINTTIITVVVVFFFSVFLWLSDIGLSWLIHGVEWVAKHIFT